MKKTNFAWGFLPRWAMDLCWILLFAGAVINWLVDPPKVVLVFFLVPPLLACIDLRFWVRPLEWVLSLSDKTSPNRDPSAP